MTFDPVLPALALAAIAATLIVLRALALRRATRSGVTSGGRGLLRWCGMTVAILLVLFAAARPGTGTAVDGETPAAAQGRAGGDENVYFVVDRSADSAVGDFGGRERMAGIRDDIKALIDSHPGARFAVIAFAARPAIEWPLSADTWSLGPVVDALAPSRDAAAGSDQVNAAAAATVLRYQLIAAGQQYPRSENLVYYFGSGAAQSSAPQGVFDTDAVDGGAVYGYGPDGAALRGIAEQLGVPYLQRTAGEPVPQDRTPTAQPAATPQSTSERVDFYWALTMLASLLLLVEIYLTARDLRRTRSTAAVAS